MNYFDEKNAIMGDKMLSDVGKRLKLSELQKEIMEGLDTEIGLTKERQSTLKSQIDDIKKQKYQRPLPSVKIPGKEDLLESEKVLAGLLSNMVGLLAEQRVAERLLAKLSMTKDSVSITSIIDDAIYENPAAVVRVLPQILKDADIVNMPGMVTLLRGLYDKAAAAEMDSKEKKWQEQNAAKLEDLQTRFNKAVIEEIQFNVQLDSVRADKTQTDFINAGNSALNDNGDNPYFK